MVQQFIVFLILLVTLILFVQGRWRYDLVALAALLVSVLTGVVPADTAFSGFGHPAVITVAAVLVISRGLGNSGLVDLFTRGISRVGSRLTLQVSALSGLVSLTSAFMNNVGALALLMPVAIRVARKNKRSPSTLLMPLSFASLLGGLITLIGTPSNLIIATFRAQDGGEPFGMFDFAPVGLGVALAGITFISLVGWRLLPRREGQASREEFFQIKEYLTEVRVPAGSKLVGISLQELNQKAETDLLVTCIVRDNQRVFSPSPLEILQGKDILVVNAGSENLQELLDKAGLELAASPETSENAKEDTKEKPAENQELHFLEAVIMPNSPLVGRSARGYNLRWRHGLNLLAVSRQGFPLRSRLGNIRFLPGDVALLQGNDQTLDEAVNLLGLLPLSDREIRIGQPRRVLLAAGIFALALTSAAWGLIPFHISLPAAALAYVLGDIITLREAYESIDWPVVVLLGTMIPVGQALEETGGANLIAEYLTLASSWLPPAAVLATMLVATMLLSNVINNAAAAVLMAPISLKLAQGMSMSPDTFLMAIALGASCPFLTPIGHQSNTLVMGPGGYQFGDYWRVGLPLQVIVTAVAIPLLLHFWPL